MLGSAKSITTTRGRSSSASSTAWCPSSASPTTRMSGSSSNMRRNPRRTRLWSSTSSTEIAGSGMRLLAMSLLRQHRHRKTHQGATRAAVLEFQAAVHQFRSLTHGDHAHPVALRTSETDTIVFHFQHHGFRQIPQANRRLLALGMLGDIVERFLHHTIEVDCDAAVQFPAGAQFLVLYRNAGLLLETRQILTERALKSDFVEDHGMQRVTTHELCPAWTERSPAPRADRRAANPDPAPGVFQCAAAWFRPPSGSGRNHREGRGKSSGMYSPAWKSIAGPVRCAARKGRPPLRIAGGYSAPGRDW